MSNAIIPEIVGQTEILEESPMTEQEQLLLIEKETKIISAQAGKMERDLIIGQNLMEIKDQKLYRSQNGKRSWEEYLIQESQKLTLDGETIHYKKAQRLRSFYKFRCLILPKKDPSVPLPTAVTQLRPIAGEMVKSPEDAVKIWKAACSEAGSDKVPTYNQVNRAFIAYRDKIINNQKQPELKSENNIETETYSEPTYQASTNTTYEQPKTSTTPVWEQERNTQEVDPYSECKKLHDVLYAAEKSLQDLHGVLYHQINKYGSAYLDQMKQFDAGLYSVSDIDEKIDDLHEQTGYLVELLQKDIEPNDLVNE